MVTLDTTPHEIYACLPFIELAREATIQIGPVSFWPSSKFAGKINPVDEAAFQNYIQSITQIKTKIKSEDDQLINTVTLTPQETTCISISSQIPIDQRDQIVIDSIYLLYFACTFRNLYYGNEIISFEPFRKMIPASMEFINHRENWEGLHINEAKREETTCIHLFDEEIYLGLGKALSAIYEKERTLDQEIIDGYKCLIRSIRYLVDRFFQKFVNLLGKGLDLSESLLEPEDILFLSTGFESLFNIDDKDPSADFKHKLRPMLHLKYSGPVEIFWKWVDDFYELKRQIIHQGTCTHSLFKSNPNFEISHLVLGIKLFIYAVYYKLFEHKLIAPIHFDAYTPPDFKWIHPEEILLFFWTESSIIRKLSVFIKRAQTDGEENELFAEISLLSDLFLSIYERYHLHPIHNHVKFMPTPLIKIESNIKQILSMIEYEEKTHPQGRLFFSIPNDLSIALKERLSSAL